jgi:hypothetical protein
MTTSRSPPGSGAHLQNALGVIPLIGVAVTPPLAVDELAARASFSAAGHTGMSFSMGTAVGHASELQSEAPPPAEALGTVARKRPLFRWSFPARRCAGREQLSGGACRVGQEEKESGLIPALPTAELTTPPLEQSSGGGSLLPPVGTALTSGMRARGACASARMRQRPWPREWQRHP